MSNPLVTIAGPRGEHIRSDAANRGLALLATARGRPMTEDDVRRTSCGEREDLCESLGLPRDALADEIYDALREVRS